MYISASLRLLRRLLSPLHTTPIRVQCIQLFHFCAFASVSLYRRVGCGCLVPVWLSSSWSVLRQGKTNNIPSFLFSFFFFRSSKRPVASLLEAQAMFETPKLRVVPAQDTPPSRSRHHHLFPTKTAETMFSRMLHRQTRRSRSPSSSLARASVRLHHLSKSTWTSTAVYLPPRRFEPPRSQRRGMLQSTRSPFPRCRLSRRTKSAHR